MQVVELLKLPPDELNRIAAERVMGWTRHSWSKEPGLKTCKRCGSSMAESWACRFVWCERNSTDWNPYHDRNDAALLLGRIGELGLQREFARFLHGIIVLTLNPYDPWPIGWMYVTATPQQLTVAAVAAMEE